MKPSRRNVLLTFALLASAIAGCGPDHGRQVVFTAPRGSSPRVDRKAGATVKAPVPGELAPSNGVDVPILQPE